MTKLDSLMTIALSGVMTGLIGMATTAQAAGLVKCAEQERCYGVAKAGQNDCATATSACSGTAKADNQKDAWVYMPKGSCLKIAGASLTAPGEQSKKK